MKDLIPVFIIAARNIAKTRNGKFFQEPVFAEASQYAA